MKRTHQVASLAATLITYSSLAGGANAANIITSGSGATGDITIMVPTITFTATANFGGGTLALIFDEALIDPSWTFTDIVGPGNELVGGSFSRYSDAGFMGNDITENDAYILTNTANSFNIGELITLNASTFTMTGNPDANLAIFPTGDYTVFLTDTVGNRVTSNAGAIPEPSSTLLLGLSALAFVTRRRRA